ncbi:MAG: F0F1 ATP synthase subunit B [Mycoplasma sp.]|nr:F0F1 ATP synthase subunit B [Mycoplasma sp.]
MLETLKETIEKIQSRAINNAGSGSDGIAEKMDSLFPSIWIIIATFGALLILLIILTKFLYNPINKMVKRRQEFIKNNIDKSIEAKESAFNLENEARNKLEDSRNVGQDLISKAKIDAENIKNQYIDQGKKEAERLIQEAKNEIQNKKKDLEKEYYNKVVTAAIDISEKIIKSKITESETKKYLNEYLGSKDNA